MRRAALILLSLAALTVACTKTDQATNQAAKARIWGKDDPPPEVEAKAKEKLDPTLLDGDPKSRSRLLGMRFDEVVARLGFVEYHGVAQLEVSRGHQNINVVEDSLIRHGIGGCFQVVQRDGNGNPLREGIFNNGVFFFSNAGGKMRVEGMVRDRPQQMREEAWQPLRVFTGYYGPRLGLKQVGKTDVSHRAGIKYALVLVDGPELVPGEGNDTPKRPKHLEGFVVFDEETGVPLRGELRGELEAPTDKQGAEPGHLTVGLDFTLRQVEGIDIVPKKFVPTITRHPTDLSALAFLDGGTHTSTVIGGPKAGARTGTKSKGRGAGE